ncbi:MAG: 2-C-methyl-D-erythritol 4-phosphate cytidylyltransferase [Leptospiraceae bacterium]|nr:2-C-methyl-D-erythritol 4-phosphate cytidylyltransferase [Leptospiraceae bacterium]
MNNIFGIILSGGTGSRMNSSLPKQFLQVNEIPLIAHSAKVFKEWGFIKSLIIVANESYIEETERALYDILEQNDRIVTGGDSRHASTLCGIDSVVTDENDILIFHDAARPFVSEKELHELCDIALKWGSATLAEKVNETIVETLEDRVESILNRDKIHTIKTPQALHTSLLKLLDKVEMEEEPTDLCSWVSHIGVKPGIVPSNPFNIKITKESDLEIANAYYPLFERWKHSFQRV